MISSTFLDVPHKDILLLLWWYHHLTVMIRKGMRTEIEHEFRKLFAGGRKLCFGRLLSYLFFPKKD